MEFIKEIARKILSDELIKEPNEDNLEKEHLLDELKAQKIKYDSLRKQYEYLNNTYLNNSFRDFYYIFENNGARLIDLDGITHLVTQNNIIKIYFVFNWDDNTSKIVIEGTDTKEKVQLKTPQIPLVCGVFSNYVVNRLVIGQILVSSMLEAIRVNIEFLVNEYLIRHNQEEENKKEIIKIDRCFYAPFLIKRNKEGKEEYEPILEERYPEALEVLKNLKDGENYWKIYHDNH